MNQSESIILPNPYPRLLRGVAITRVVPRGVWVCMEELVWFSVGCWTRPSGFLHVDIYRN
ncbi:hypothetical protein E2C01_059137 [Portunus trituberculatus]|uniref:Uncharacterized protein n=1 Tax=Portunus trituberculatus TaxID=210409 RepID=A0A5B7H4K5_PORTR|nr:hypothetical protein [Portunus trituberculatus]